MAVVFDRSSSLFPDPSVGDILSPPSPPPPPPENISGSEEGLVAESDRRSENLKPSESKRRLRKQRRSTSCLDIDDYEIGDILSALTIAYCRYCVFDSSDDDDDDDVSKRGKEDKPIDLPDNDDHDDDDVVPPTRSPTILGKRRPSDEYDYDDDDDEYDDDDDDDADADDDDDDDDTKDPDLVNDDDHIDDDDHDGRPDERLAEPLILKPGIYNCDVCGSLDHPCSMCPYWYHLSPNSKIGPDFQLACDLCGRCGDKVTEACKCLRLVHKIDHGL